MFVAKFTPKLEALIDLDQPVEEIKLTILQIVNTFPGKQKELLEEVDTWLGELLASIEKGQQKIAEENTESTK